MHHWFENPNLQLRPSRELNPAIQSVRATLLKDECNEETLEAKPDDFVLSQEGRDLDLVGSGDDGGERMRVVMR